MIHSGKSMRDSEEYKGHEVASWFYCLDYIALVDGNELSNFYLSSSAARQAGRRYVDEIEKEQ